MRNTVEEKTWGEFRECGFLWFVNRLLHFFGWAICFEMDNNEITKVYPARVVFRGFSEGCETEGFLQVSQYMANNKAMFDATITSLKGELDAEKKKKGDF